MTFLGDISRYAFNNKDNIGKVLFAVSILVLIYMFINPINQVIIMADERFTINLLLLPFNDMWSQIVQDVHPPLYYFILLAGYDILKNFGFDIIFASKIISIIPYILLLLVSITKIRENYNWITTGLFAFSIATMSEFFIKIETIRMYSWGLLFLVLAFIFLKDVIEKQDIKSWILFTLFSVLAMYIHNIILIPLGIMYMLLLIHIYLNSSDKKDEIKKWFVSAIITALCYVPWLFVLISQINASHGNGQTTFDPVFCFLSFACYRPNMILYILTIVLLIILALILLNEYKSKDAKTEKTIKLAHVIIGLVMFFATVILGAVILPIVFAPINARYLIPLSGVLWLAVSILVGTYTRNRKLWMIAVLLILVIGVANFTTEVDASHNLYDTGIKEKKLLNDLNKPDNIIYYSTRFAYVTHNYELNNTQPYTVKNLNVSYNAKYTKDTNITRLLENNPDKNVYIIKNVKSPKDYDYGPTLKAEKIGTSKGLWIIKVTLTNP